MPDPTVIWINDSNIHTSKLITIFSIHFNGPSIDVDDSFVTMIESRWCDLNNNNSTLWRLLSLIQLYIIDLFTELLHIFFGIIHIILRIPLEPVLVLLRRCLFHLLILSYFFYLLKINYKFVKFVELFN